MKTSEIIYLGGLRTEAVHLRSGSKIVTDAPPDNNGRGEAFSPTDLLATALGCCMLTIMGIIAERNNIDIEGTKVGITKIMAANPRRVSEVVVEINMPGNYSEKEKELLENAARTCPVACSIHPDIKQSLSFSYS
jgi:putative redox protein